MTALLERKLVRYALYALWAFVAFVISLLLAFPDERVKQIIIVQAEKQLGYKYEVEITDLDVWWRLGLELEGITLKERWSPQKKAQIAKEVAEGAPPQLPFTVTVPRMAVRLAPLDSILGAGISGVGEVDFEDGGLIALQGTFSSGQTDVALRFNEVDLMRSGIVASVTGIPGFGTLDGEVALTFNPKARVPSAGSIDLTGSKITLGPADVRREDLPPFIARELPSMGFLEVPQTNFGNGKILASIATPKGGRSPALTFEEFGSEGRDIRTELWGNVSLAAPTARSKADLKARVQIDSKFVRKNNLGFVLNLPQFRRGKGKDNWYGLQLVGLLGNIKFTGSKVASGGPDGASAAAAPAKAPAAKKAAPKATPRKATPKPTPKPTPTPAPSKEDDGFDEAEAEALDGVDELDDSDAKEKVAPKAIRAPTPGIPVIGGDPNDSAPIDSPGPQ